ncbi:MAG: efflux RND transporter periplasmic adaptor subunit [Deltaproteobacteria bacterium]|nr:efflux RND transporter periplasmic adaptor subunit [Deltaproteobacteria bacterium]
MTGKKIITQILLILVALGAGGAGTYYWMTRGSMLDHSDRGAKGKAAEEKKQYTCPMHPFIVTDQPGACPICGMAVVPVKSGSAASSGEKKERKIQYWVAPMDPNYRSDQPGKSPMGMDLVPVYEDGAGDEGTIRVDPNTIQSIGVRTAPATVGELTKTIRTVGRVAYDERRIGTVNAKIGGWIEKLYVNTTGEEVRKGQPLIEIYSPDLVSAQQEYLIARRHYGQVKNSPFPDVVKSAQDLLDSARKRLSYWDIAEAQIEELERTGTVRKTLVLYSPFRGVVVQKAVFDGTKVMPGMELFRIADLSRVWVQGDVYEYELPWVKVGVPATVTLDYLPGKTYRGKITYIYPYLEGKTRTATVRVELANPDGELKPDMYAHIDLNPRVGEKTVLVPSEAVIRSGIRNVVFVSKGEGRFEPREIELGLEGEEGLVQVLSGLAGNELVVVSAQFLLDSESSLKEALKKFRNAAGETSPSSGAPAGQSTPAAPEHKMDDGSSMKGMENHTEGAKGQ